MRKGVLKLNILTLVKYYEPSKGGIETVAKNIINGVRENLKTQDITVICNNHQEFNKDIIEFQDNLKIIRNKSFFWKSQPFSLGFTGLFSEIKKADIIHHHYPYPTMELALLPFLSLLKRKKLIITWHANISNSRWKKIEKFYNFLIFELLKVSNQIVVTSPQLLKNSVILQQFKNKVTVIPLSFQPHKKINHPKSFSLTGEKVKLLFVGKMRTYKGLKYLLEAIVDLDVELNLVGKGEEEINLRKYIENRNLEHKVFIHNDVSDDELSDFYMNSHIFILPSINEAEAFGVVQLEALSYGMPVINTNLKSGVPFVSLDGVSGFTVEPKNSEELRTAIIKLIENPVLYNEFSKNAIERAENFTNDKMVERYWELYES